WLRAPRHSWVGLTIADRRICSRAKTSGNFKTSSERAWADNTSGVFPAAFLAKTSAPDSQKKTAQK
ncbi:MAG: hypothetical protein OXH06_02340, partial [Gemmatimonadetes bacterium]|nr:hypothetical protein [Gemmatimonadota bacterium]